MKIAIITGASSGMGREFVKQISCEDGLDEIWAVARRQEKLDELQGIAKCSIRTLPMDLRSEACTGILERLLEREKPEVSVLVCAAGFGRIGATESISRRDHDGMISVNCRAAVDVTLAALPYMDEGSRIIEICSVAGFNPLPRLNTYAASKAFLMSWTKALHHELFADGIHVTAMCPYWVKDTEFIPRARKTDEKGIRHFPLASRPPSAVAWTLTLSRWNMWVASPSPVALILRFFTKFIPHAIIVPIWDFIRRI